MKAEERLLEMTREKVTSQNRAMVMQMIEANR
jgi:hypothetical protein